jgi:hypothetical protein
VKYLRTLGFLADFHRLPEEHRKLFVHVVALLLRPALDEGAHMGKAPWPKALRIHRIGANYSMTWSFSGPDGRALFRIDDVEGEPVLVWLRVGSHSIYKDYTRPAVACSLPEPDILSQREGALPGGARRGLEGPSPAGGVGSGAGEGR